MKAHAGQSRGTPGQARSKAHTLQEQLDGNINIFQTLGDAKTLPGYACEDRGVFVEVNATKAPLDQQVVVISIFPAPQQDVMKAMMWTDKVMKGVELVMFSYFGNFDPEQFEMDYINPRELIQHREDRSLSLAERLVVRIKPPLSELYVERGESLVRQIITRLRAALEQV